MMGRGAATVGSRCGGMARIGWVGGLAMAVTGMGGGRVLRYMRDLGRRSPMTFGRVMGLTCVEHIVWDVWGTSHAHHHVTYGNAVGWEGSGDRTWHV